MKTTTWETGKFTTEADVELPHDVLQWLGFTKCCNPRTHTSSLLLPISRPTFLPFLLVFFLFHFAKFPLLFTVFIAQCQYIW